MDEAEYRRHPALNWSRLKSMRVSPLQYRHDSERERDDTLSMRIGRAVHMMLLEPALAESRIAVYDGARRGKAWEQFADENAGKEILTATEWDRVRGCVDAVLRHRVGSRHLAGAAEQSVFWTDPDTGLECKCRVDMINGRLRELKTAADITPERFAAQAARLGYHGQIAFCQDGLIASGHDLHDWPILLVVQSDPPHDVVPYVVPPEVVETGRAEYKRCLWRYRECMESGEWPGLCVDRELMFALPAWATATADDDDAPITIGGVPLGL